MNESELRRLTELRALLEGFAARHAAVNLRESPERLDSLRDILNQLNDATQRRNYEDFRKSDYALHLGVVTLADVPCLVGNWQTLWESQRAFHEQTFEECFPDTRFLAEEHTHLVETLALGDPTAAEDAARNHLEAVWFRLADQEPDQREAACGDALQRTVSHLAFSFSRPLRLEEVAARVAFTSPGNLSRLFRNYYGIGFKQYLQKLRLEKGAELLKSTQLPIARIASRVGYRDTSRFGQHFKRRFEVTPTEYRQK